MSKPRTILHVDLDAFFCAVEELDDAALRGTPFVVAGDPRGRGVVASASYAARSFGVHSAMPTGRALRLCPGLRVVRPRHALYARTSERVLALLRDSAPAVEPISIDEAFLDVSDDPRPGQTVAETLRGATAARFPRPPPGGVATKRRGAKIATGVGKPGGLIVVPPGDEARFLSPLPVQALWGIGPKARERLEGLDIRTVGDLRAKNPVWMEAQFGSFGIELAARARGEDDRPVEESREARSMSSETTFARDVSDGAALRRAPPGLSRSGGGRPRGGGGGRGGGRVPGRASRFSPGMSPTVLPCGGPCRSCPIRSVRACARRGWPERPSVSSSVGPISPRSPGNPPWTNRPTRTARSTGSSPVCWNVPGRRGGRSA